MPALWPAHPPWEGWSHGLITQLWGGFTLYLFFTRVNPIPSLWPGEGLSFSGGQPAATFSLSLRGWLSSLGYRVQAVLSL